MSGNGLFFGTTVEQSSLFGRLFEELCEAAREFRENPRSYLTTAIRGDGAGGRRRQSLLKLGLALGLLFYSAFFLTLLVVWTIKTNHQAVVGQDASWERLPPHIWAVVPPPDTNPQKADKDSDRKGGGGGGDESNLPASQGVPPPFSWEQQVIAPTTRPTVKPPELPMAEILHGNPANSFKRDDLAPTGLPDATVGPPSDGFGKNGGVGTGNRGGFGPGDGPGFGPGKNGNRGGDDNNYSIDGRRDPSGAENRVDSKPVALNKPRPNYTEEARKNKVQGKVRARVLVGADGAVKRVQIVGAGLADGLSEEAVRAAYQMRFRPAMKDNQPVAFWVAIEIEFNLR